ncbi:restriction endonuclease subunit S [Clostridioides difficile]|uniref:restriction endonuclease subunit S n=1 Tax=Clostridioides difficile TaxID=1496 RepID=UPI000944CA2D|nr:restriction endonuclease subunit S [Clostridioides difficile]KAK2245376.1 hypothetical protein XC29_00650 [Clostridioides difficile]MBY1968819.1 restriction endonuclease subunit S [Clostridioides difficile]MDM9959228.1 restriction endonuclease subunit S [Clostridioides difficile]MDO0132421.1 restriction endonuclease subunit S [Clostridioides difficile]HBF0312684.1 restriction endonuclease subunit S [Clostridioides difficile]
MKNIPNLRFSGFKYEWKEEKLGNIVDKFQYGMNSSSKKFDNINKYIRITDINENTNKYISSNPVSPSGLLEDKYLVKENDILFARTGASTGKTYIYNKEDGKLYFAGFLIRANVIKSYNSKFVFFQTLTEKYNRWVKVVSMRSGQPGINAEEYASYYVNIPSLKEQEKIASFFTLINKKIEKQSEKIELLKDYKKGMMKRIFSQKIRFKGYLNWKEGKLKDILNEKLYKINKPLNPYWRLGIRSHGKGTFHEYVADPSKINMDKLYEVKTDMLIVNITFAWEHAIAITNVKDEGKLVSHRFPTYVFKNNARDTFYKYYILTPKFKYYLVNASPGGAGRNRVLNKKQFLEIPIPIPSIKEQEKIASFLSLIDKKIEKDEEKLELLNQYKKGLLQQMFV